MSSVDIVIPCHGYGRYLRECVLSVLAQDVPDCRVLIIDDHSPDDTWEVAQLLASQEPRVSVRRHGANKGHIATYNAGVAWCESEYMLLLSADDYLLPGALAHAMAVMDEDPGIGLCFGSAVLLRADGTRQPITLPVHLVATPSHVMDGPDFILACAAARSRDIVPTPTAVVRTSLVKRIGAYRPELPHSADMELWLRIAAHARVACLARAQAVYRRHAANMSSAYHQDHRLKDILQREAAFEAFRVGCADVLPNAASLHRRLLRGLGEDATEEARLAHEAGRPALAKTLLALALRLDTPLRTAASAPRRAQTERSLP